MTLEVVSPTSALLDGRYLLVDRVGRGGAASVYRAEDTHLGRTVAIKMIHDGESLLGSADRAHTEKALLASLNHPALVTLFDAQLDPGRPQYLVMEYVDGPTLADRMTQGPIPGPHLALIVRDLAEGLAAVHAAGIVHRDVKPSNVLMSPPRRRDGGPWTAKLADFGIAYSIDDSPRTTTPGIVLGTLTYMAPEQLTDTDPSTPVDVFALGLVALEALTGTPGYAPTGSGRAAAVTRVLSPPTIPADLDGDWRDLIERMTRLEPGERPTAADVAKDARALARKHGPSSDDGPLYAAAPRPVAAAAPSRNADASAAGDTGTTGKTAVLPRVAAPRRPRRRVLFGAAALAVAGALVTTAAMLEPSAAGMARASSETVVRAPATPVHDQTAPAAVPEDSAPAETETVTVTVTDQGDQGDQGDQSGPGSQGSNGNGGQKGSEKKPENSGKSDKGKNG